MKKRIPLIAVVLITLVSLSSFLVSPSKESKEKQNTGKTVLLERYMEMYGAAFKAVDYNLEAFVKMTPKQFKSATGIKLSLKETLEFKYAQKQIKKNLTKPQGGGDFPKAAYIILVILGWGFIPIGLLTNWEGNDWWVNLLLTFLCWLPGVIHGLVKMKNYYS